jgi:hypothetical protein
MRQSAYQLDGAPVYQGKDETGHIWWDIGCDCKDCKQDRFYATDDDEKKVVYPISSQQALQQRYEAGDPEVGLLGEPSGKLDYFVLYPLKDSPDPIPSLVFLPPYEEEAKNPSPPMNVDKTGSQSSTMKEPWPEDFDRARSPPKYQQGCESQFESDFSVTNLR